MRKIHLDTGVWEYKVGKSIVAIFSPTKEKHIVSKNHIPNVEYDDRCYGGHDGVRVSPSDIRNYIEESLL